jgi:hypothetical protein
MHKLKEFDNISTQISLDFKLDNDYRLELQSFIPAL